MLNSLLPVWFLMALLPFYARDIWYPQPGKFTQEVGPTATIKIGLLINDANARDAKNAAEMAIRKANEKGGVNGRSFQLVVRSMEGPWGTGSKQAVNLIFDEEVWAIIGSHDGRNAHLVEQVSAKARILFLSAWASDQTLSQAFVPWYFSCVPNDNQQAATLVEEIYIRRKLQQIAIIAENSYDTKQALNSFLKNSQIVGIESPSQYYYDTSGEDYNDLLNRIEKIKPEGMVLFGSPASALKLIQQLRNRNMKQSVFGSLSMSGESELMTQALKNIKNVVLISSELWFTPNGLAFQSAFRKLYGYKPGAVAAYAYDGVNMVIEAIKKAGLDRDNLQKSMALLHYEGVTGVIQFDDKGNRLDDAVLMEIKNGIPVIL